MATSLRHMFLAAAFSLLACVSVSAQNPVRKDIRKGNRDFRKEDYKAAEIDYRKAIVKDSASFAAGYNLGNTLYKMGDKEQAGKIYDKLKETAPASEHAADYYYNVGNVTADAGNWQAAVDSYRQALLRNPSDMDAKENYIYAKKKLEDQQNQQNQQNQDNQDNKDDNKDKNKDKDQNQDQNQNPNQDNQDGNNSPQNQQQGRQPKITPQAAQQMLQAIQEKEKETQDKVNKEKAQVLKSRQKEKHW